MRSSSRFLPRALAGKRAVLNPAPQLEAAAAPSVRAWVRSVLWGLRLAARRRRRQLLRAVLPAPCSPARLKAETAAQMKPRRAAASQQALARNAALRFQAFQASPPWAELQMAATVCTTAAARRRSRQRRHTRRQARRRSSAPAALARRPARCHAAPLHSRTASLRSCRRRRRSSSRSLLCRRSVPRPQARATPHHTSATPRPLGAARPRPRRPASARAKPPPLALHLSARNSRPSCLRLPCRHSGASLGSVHSPASRL
mmetsp:Transcript_25717/g.56358  ORF Transcript_25717/g.56358 Transcript_25717/m.56358 type:complete len:259 (+) Transcript_25717:600-1376(+)